MPNDIKLRDFGTDKVERYTRDFVTSPIDEGRTYEDLQIPAKLRQRAAVEKFSDIGTFGPVLQEMLSKSLTATFTSAHASSDLEIKHNLRSIPSTVLISIPSADARIWRGTSAWNRTSIFLRASAACYVQVFPIVAV